MYDIKQLEEEWKRYRKKKLKPWIIGSGILVVLIFFIIFFQTNNGALINYLNRSNVNQSLEKDEGSIRSVEMKLKESVLLDGALDTLEVKENVIEMAEKTVKSDDSILVDIPILDEINDAPAVEEAGTRKKVHLEIIDSTSVSGYQDVERRFFESHDIDDALFLAKSYYKNGNYEKSEYWALQTNKLDESKEESLLIFVKSKVKLGHKNEALSILNAYLKQSESQEAKKLLYRIENDKL